MRANKKEPLVSVIMSEYNTDTTLLEKSIESIIKQTYTNIELIIVDDKGTNDVEKIIKKYNDSRIILLKNNTNCGFVYSLNKALKQARGTYVARMDTDDYSYRNRIRKQVSFMMEHPEYDVIGGNVEYFDGDRVWGRSRLEGIVTKTAIAKASPLAHPTIIAKKEVITNVGGYPNYNRCEDYALWIKLFAKGYKLYNMKDAVLRYHLSLEDFKKRNIFRRKDFFRMLKQHYRKYLKPTKLQYLKIYSKNIITGIIPPKLLFSIHRKRGK